MQVKVDEELVRHIASLSRIKLSDEEVKALVEQFNSILSYFSKIQSESSDLPIPSPMDRLVDLTNVYRCDEPRRSETDFTTLFPNKEGRYIKAPKIV
ncbi:MAG: Asp-tRNA(Asn)/Glu-tRNA(Gln) amidotransferase subunit GatC [Candidatus Marsarchaeota archaeon]